MKITFTANKYKIADRFREVMTEKLEKLSKYFGDDATAVVACSKQNKTEKLEITIKNKGILFRAEVTSDNMYNNIDLALPKLERQIVRNRDKKITSRKKGSVDNDFAFIEKAPEQKLPDISKTKVFDLDAILVEDAKDAIERLGHNFYIFLNVETGKVNVIYRRNDGKFGLIEVNY